MRTTRFRKVAREHPIALYGCSRTLSRSPVRRDNPHKIAVMDSGNIWKFFCLIRVTGDEFFA